ncbi:MAG: hypothetical protein Q7S34_02995 [bacterium]|nr:hypothetical protein [bacterium]
MKLFKTVLVILAVAGGLFFIWSKGYLQEEKVNESRTISFCNTKIGEAKNGRIYLNFEGSTYSFEANIDAPDLFSSDNLTLFGGCGSGGSMPPDWNERVTYKRLVIHLPRKDNLVKVTYVCDAPLSGRIFANCETNGQDKINQYEFGSGYIDKINGLADRYDSLYRWEKIMIKKISDRNMIFEGIMISPSGQSEIFGTDKCEDDPKYICKTENEKNNYSYIDPSSLFNIYKSLREFNMVSDLRIYENTIKYNTDEQWYKTLLLMEDGMLRKVQSDEYLQRLINKVDNLSGEKDWGHIIDSFRIEN